MSGEERITFTVMLPPESAALGDVLRAVVENGVGLLVLQPMWKVRGRLHQEARDWAKAQRRRLWPVLLLPAPYDDVALAARELVTPEKATRLKVALEALRATMERAPAVAPLSTYDEWRAEHGS